MTFQTLLATLAASGIQLRGAGEEVVVTGNKKALTAELIGELRAQKAALRDLVREHGGWWAPGRITPEMLPLVALTQAEIDGIVAGVDGGAGNVQDIYPLAPLQEGIFFHHLLAREGDPYLSVELFVMESRERLDAFVGALRAVIDRHDILRTSVVWEGLPEPVQVVWRRARLRVEEVELDPAEADVPKALRARFDPRRSRMDLGRAPLIRACVARDEAKGRWVLLLQKHHLIIDHTSEEVLQDEIRAHLQGREAELPAPLPFRTFVAQARRSASREEHEAFFRALLGDVDEPTAPFGVLNVWSDGSGIDEAVRPVEPAVAARLRSRARALGVSAASVCHVAWGQVLARVTGRDDVVFGTVLFGRMQGGKGADRVMGLFLNTLPVRMRVGGGGAEAAVREMHRQMAELLRHEHASLALAQRCSGVAPPSPLFTSLLNYRYSGQGGEKQPAPPPEAPRAMAGIRGFFSQERTNYPVGLSIDDMGEGLVLSVQVAAPIDPRRVCAFMQTALERLVEALETAPAMPLREVDVLPEAERRQVVEAWNATGAEYPRGSCVHELFEAQAARTPDAEALVHEDGSLSYAELNRRANRLAHHLRSLGVGPDARVAICVERSPEMVVGVLAVLKAGGAYLPLDPSYPAERLRYMIEDGAPRVVLATSAIAAAEDGPLAGAGAPVVALDRGGWEDAPETNPARGALTPGHLAYVIYTSGSTGRPKGVMVPHQGVCNLALGQIRAFEVRPESRVLQFASFSFDAFVSELATTLCRGAALHLPPRGALLAGETLVRALDGITHATLPPAVLASLPEDEALPSLRTLVVAGDVVTREAARRWGRGRRLLNAYGPTEASVCATIHLCDVDAPGSPPIGGPIANVRTYVLDGAGDPAPVGVAGEIHVGGAGVARGYHGRPELTAERFVADPFGGEPGARLYRTGDLGRWRPDGNLEFLGRDDFQVKVRGFRIELGEIEARLREHEGVREAAAVAREDAPGEPRLVAYWVGEAVEADALRRVLGERLPEHMLPAAYVRLESMPLSPNGKVDRRALPAPEGEAYARRGYEAPVGEVEEALAGIWSELLKVERAGRWDHFFELGGHSLLAVRVISRVRQALGAEVSLAELFRTPVLAELARAIEGAARTELPPIERADRGARLPLSYAQQRLWFLEQMGDLGSAYHISTGLRLRGELDGAALARALDRLVERHEALRTTFPARGGEPEQRIGPETSGFALAEHDLAGGAGDALERVMAGEAAAPFDLERGPLIRGALIRLAADDHVLLLTMHHIVADGWSMDVFADELGRLYGAFRAGQDDPLPPLPIQYADYAAWQRRWVDGEVLREQAEYWKRTLSGAPELLELPTDHPRPARPDYAGATIGVDLGEELTAGVKALSRRHGTTLHMTLLAGWAAVLARLSGQDDVVVGGPTANRGRREIEGLIGFFVNSLALRVDLSGRPTVAELLARVKARALEAQQNQDIPFEQVVELAQPVRSLAHTPLFQATFTWQNASEGRLELPGLRLVGAGAASAVAAKFDLSLTLGEAGGRIGGSVVYATSLFRRATVERFVGYLRRALEEMVADESRPVDRLALMPADERARVVEEWNRTEAEFPLGACLHELFEAQVERAPAGTAVVFDGESLTYAELNARANRLAHHLRSLGVGPDARVAICAERSPEIVVGMLAVLKAGGAYLPLDPGYPAERLAYMLADGAPAVVLAREDLRGRVDHAGVPVLALDADAAAWADRPDTNPGRGALTPEHLAYVIYTSGSTGRPKGVMVGHRGACNLVAAQVAAFGVETGSRVLQFASFSFDASVSEVLTALCTGAALHLAPRGALLAGETLVRALDGVTHVTLPPSVLAALPDDVRLPSVRTLVLAGEALPEPVARRWGPGRRLINAYGPTEATVCATLHHWRDGEAGSPPIGRPMANARVYVLDRGGEPVPVGVAGELYVGGAGVTRGYLGRPALTAERFVADPFGGGPGARLYRTGDRARWRPDGTIDFLGRVDHQVKVRGFRIELGEIEARLGEHAEVREAAVVAREDTPGEKRLVAYLAGEEPVRAAALREHLGETLPEYMVPSAYVWLERLPRTPNGKLDRAALPAPESVLDAAGEHEAPVGDTEQALAEIWSEVLGSERVSRRDHFFELGGHSLLAVQVISRVREVLEVEVAPGELFAQPVLADFARQVENAARADLPPIGRADREGRLPLSFAQQRLWFLEQLGALGSAYHIPGSLRMRGELDRAALARALSGIVARHEALRTTFAQVDGVAEQRIAPAEASGFHLVEHDLGGRADTRAELGRIMAEEARAPFDLERGPLIRGRLIRLAADDHVLLLTMHHIVSDAWSMGVLTRELSALYAAHRDGGEAELPGLPVQYADYAAWQRSWVSGEVLREQADYWTRTLAGAPELLELPTDHPRPAQMDHAGAVLGVMLDEELTAGLKALSRRHGTTLFMTLLAGWAVVLGRLSGQDDVVVGTPTAGRGRREIEGLIGFFINTLALRVELSDAPTVAELLGRVKKRALSAQHHQDLPFEQVVELLDPARSMAHHPLFQVMFTWQNMSRDVLELPGLELAGVGGAGSPDVQAKFDLSLSLQAAGDRIVGGLTYATGLFERETVARWMGYLRRVLEEMAADEGRRVERLALLPPEERSRVVDEWNRTEAAYAGDACVHELFEAQAARTPSATALVAEGRAPLTYAELNARANRLAHHLVARGVGPDVCVGLCLERAPEMVVALLAVLKAGGAYVPLDPEYPADRLAYMLADSAPAVLLTQASLAELFAGARAPRIRVDADAGDWAGEPETDPARGALTPEHLAYVIYTSGSTGQPKGVMNQHRALVNRLTWGRRAWEIGADEAILCKTSLNFDGSVREIFLPLMAGGRVVLARPGGHRDPSYLLEVIGRESITTVNLVPSLLQLLLEAPEVEKLRGLERILCGGEALPGALLERCRQLLPEVEIHNLYGPSEAATAVTARCRVEPGRAAVPIGGPSANARVYVLDGAGEPVPVGVAGELYIGGVPVARGYLNRPRMTAERFVADPFGGEPGARLYRTGDVVRWRKSAEVRECGSAVDPSESAHDGAPAHSRTSALTHSRTAVLEFVGRNDHQVKVRGFRVELGEIEARLLEHPGVREAVAVVREDAPGDRRLVAYCVADAAADAEALRAHLAGRLPEYMVPAAYVRLDALPLTPNGKLDRKALPAPEGDAYATRGYEAPLGETEEALAEIWCEVLRIERVGRHDDFFELGGHSLLAVQVISRVRQALAVEAELGQIFTRPVLQDFARGLETAARAELPPIEPAPREGRLPLSFAQQRLWFLEELGNLGSTYHVPGRLRLRGDLDRAALARALDGIVARHEVLRTVFAQVDGVPEQRIAPADAGFHLVEHDLGGAADAEAELGRLMAGEAAAPFDLERGPLIRGRLIRMAADDHMLLLTMHHIVSDAWSMGVLTREFSALYAAFHRGEADPLPPLPVQYADYAAWQRRWVEGEVLQAQADYWTRTLSGAPELLELPTDRPRPAQQDFAGATAGLVLGEELTAALRALSRRHGTTLFMTVLAGWATVLSRLSGQEDVVVGTPSANRGRREVEGLIGFFLNTLALRVELSGAPTVAEVLARVKARALEAQANQDIPFEQVVELVQPARSLAHTPLFQVMFAWQNASGEELALPGLKPAPAGAASPHVTAKFDLMLALGEAGGRIVGAVEYATALFDRETVERWLGYLRRVLEAFAADDAAATDRLSMIPEDERRLVVREFNDTRREYPREACVHELVEAQAARTPGAVAVVFEGERVTYADLNARANRLAHHLRALGVRPDARVGICVERSVEMVVGLLGILKAGGAYVPLDASYPVDRLRNMLEDSDPAVLLTHPPLAGTVAELAAGSAVAVLDLTADEAWAHQPETNPGREGLGPRNLGHVLFTSGSTGRPKGVMLEHGSLVNRLAWMQDRYGMTADEALLQKTPFSFDVSFWEFFWPLMVGARLVMARPGGHRDPAYLVDVIQREGITHAHFVPSMLPLFLEHPDAAKCTGLLRVPVSGEAVSAALVRLFHERLPGVELTNQYGPTESGEVTEWACASDAERVSIGRAIHNSTVYVLDRTGEPVPVGVSGELFIGGIAVARGYLGRPRLTAERFVPDPFSAEPGARLYRTGDLCRWLPDGTLEYLGRADFQVKVRGFRVEPGEVEARLAAHPGVREAVVLALDDGAGGKRLVAYVVGEALEGEALRAHLSAHLPEYMVPAAFVRLDAFPVTPNGKLDRRALPAPDADAFAARAYEAPVGTTEQTLAEIWSEVLGIGRVGRRDNFFELGGHSLLAVQVISRVRQVLEVEVPLRTVFERPTLSELAQHVMAAQLAQFDPLQIAHLTELVRASAEAALPWPGPGASPDHSPES